MTFITDPAIFFDYSYTNCDPTGDFDQSFILKIKPCTQSPKNWRQECLNTARYIRDNSSGPIMVSLSGGIDSEIVCRSFVEQNIDIEVFTVLYTDYSNDYDVQWAHEFCKKSGLKHHVHQITFEKLYSEHLEKYAALGYEAVNLFRYFQLFVIDQIAQMGYSAVLGGGEQAYKIKKNTLGLAFDPGFLNSLNYGRSTHRQHWPYFFMSRPEMVHAYLHEPEVQAGLATFQSSSLQNSHEIKQQVYTRYFTDLALRPKYSGMDHVHARRLELQAGLIKRFPELRKKFIRLDQLRTYLRAV